jgi:hypothetical protein
MEGHFTIYLYPESDDSIQWSKYPNSGNNFDKVDEEVADDDSTYVYCDVTNSTKLDWYNLQDTTPPEVGDAIDSISFHMRSKYTSVIKPTSIEFMYQFEGEAQTAITFTEQTTSYEDFSYQLTGPFTWEEINTLKIGTGLFTDAGFPLLSARTTQVYVVLNCSRIVASPSIYVMGFF